jgi:hypothetical protein
MRHFLIAILTIVLLTNCNNQQVRTVDKNERFDLLPEPDRELRLQAEAIQKLRKADCNFLEPDTSLSGITIVNSASATKVIGDSNIAEGIVKYHFYSQHREETLTLTQHPGDGKNQISVFKVGYSDTINRGYKQLHIDTFKTEKGIKLGLTKNEIIARFGNCYATIDSTDDYIELYYMIELPKDSKTKLLQNNNMPLYYASYKILRGKLAAFEFGFEYP